MNLTIRSRSSLTGNSNFHNLFWLSRLNSDWVCSPFALQATFVAFPRLLLIRLDDDHSSIKRRQLHLHVPRWDHRTQLVQRRSPQKQIIRWRGINYNVPDVHRPSWGAIRKIHPQLDVSSHFHLIFRRTTLASREITTNCWMLTKTSH